MGRLLAEEEARLAGEAGGAGAMVGRLKGGAGVALGANRDRDRCLRGSPKLVVPVMAEVLGVVVTMDKQIANMKQDHLEEGKLMLSGRELGCLRLIIIVTCPRPCPGGHPR